MEPDVFSGLIRLDPAAPLGLVQQIYHALRAAILAGPLKAGDALPSTRRAAAALGVGRNTLAAAYELLAAEGFLQTRPGRRPRIAAAPPAPPAAEVAPPGFSARAGCIRPAPERRGIMAPGSPDPRLFPADLWARLLRHSARHRQDGAEGYAHFSGLPELRQVLADHIRRHRGLDVTAEDLLVTAGTQSSLMICAHAFTDPGDVALIEDPGYRSAVASFSAAGLVCRPLPVDAEGARAEGGFFSGARIAYLTPSTQYPTGVRMSLARRIALLQAAKASGTQLIEDDYDSEFVWRGRGIAALGALAQGAGVITIGSAAKSLLPGLRLGWICAPKGTAARLRQIQRGLGIAANVHAQAAFASFLGSGQHRAHIARISGAYAERMEALRAAILARLAPEVEVSRPDGGLQLLVRLPDGVEDRALAATLNAAGYGVAPLSDYALGPCGCGLVIGFGNMAPGDAARFARLLAEGIAQHRPG